MMKNWKKYTVANLVEMGFLEKPLDGNHGSLHPKSSDYVSKGVPFIMANNLINGKIDYKNCKYISKEQSNTLKKGKTVNGDVLLTHKATIGRTAIVNTDMEYLILTPQVTYYRTKKNIDNLYLKYYFDSPIFQSLLANWSGGGSTRAYIGITVQLKLPILLPPLKEQKAIAKVLSSLDEKIEVNNRMNEVLENMAQAVFKRCFVDFEFPNEDGEPYKSSGGKMIESELGLIPEGWGIYKLKDILDVNPTYQLKKKNFYNFISMKEIDTNSSRIDFSESVKKEFKSGGMKFTNGETLLARITPCLENGKTGYVDFLEDDEVAFGSTEFIVLRMKYPFSLPFSYIIAKNDIFRNYAIKNLSGTTGRQRVSKSQIEDYKLVLPKISYGKINSIYTSPEFDSEVENTADSCKGKYYPPQIRENFGFLPTFNRLIEQIFEQIKKGHKENIILKKTRDTLLPKLISGEIRVPFEGN